LCLRQRDVLTAEFSKTDAARHVVARSTTTSNRQIKCDTASGHLDNPETLTHTQSAVGADVDLIVDCWVEGIDDPGASVVHKIAVVAWNVIAEKIVHRCAGRWFAEQGKHLEATILLRPC